MSERILAKVVEVDDVIPHSNADSLELAIIGGWQCCVKKEEFKKGEKAVYFEIDSMLPVEDPLFSFLQARGSLKEVDGKQYSRIRTIKLRKELSQGLLIPLPEQFSKAKVGDDLTKKLGVIKFEKPEAGVTVAAIAKPKGFMDNLINKIIGKTPTPMKEWPQFIQKTDQERVQNKTVAYADAVEKGEEFEITYKLDGSSWTGFLVKQGDKLRSGVCSRNYELQSQDIILSKKQKYRLWLGEFLQFNRRILKNRTLRMPELKHKIEVGSSNFVTMFNFYNVDQVLRDYYEKTGKLIALQGEMIGPGIQKNFEGNKALDLYIYNVYLINDTKNILSKPGYVLPEEARKIVESLGMNYVPILTYGNLLPTVKECLDQAEGPAAFKTGKYREGLVYKSLTRDFSFKAISNSYLLKNEE